jgi:uncharacterized protein
VEATSRSSIDTQKPKLAIVGTGIAGLASGYFLKDTHEITFFDVNDYVGGHTNTVQVPYRDGMFPMDTGFMVFNLATYPNLIRFFKELDVPYYPTDMSFSVQHCPLNLEWNGAGLNRVFGQRKNILNLRFWRMLQQLMRFNKESPQLLKDNVWDDGIVVEKSIQTYAEEKGYGEDFLTMFLLPMSAAIWSTDPDRMRAFPIQALLRFFENHGFFGLDSHHQWYTVEGGSQSYIQKLKPLLNARFITGEPVVSLEETEKGVTLVSQNGHTQALSEQVFDRVILASHADEALKMLAKPTELQQKLLSPFQYEQNLTTIHTDSSVMPKAPLCWASWNYRLAPDLSGALQATTHYWMNNLQKLPTPTAHFVSLNADHLISPEKIIQQIHYTHPRFDVETLKAQHHLPSLNKVSEQQKIFFCGSYFRYGFHEDAFTSALTLCRVLLGDTLWR